MTASEPVLLRIHDGIAQLELNRPDVGNAIDLTMARGLRDAVYAVRSVGGIRVVALRSSGARFCVGGDVGEIAAAKRRDAHLAELVATTHDALIALCSLPIVLVTAVQGAVAGAGLGLVLASDIVLAADSATFRTAYADIGLSPDCGVSALLPQVLGPRRAALLTLTSKVLSAAEALDWGLVSETVYDDQLDQRAEEIVGALNSPVAAVGQSALLLRKSSQLCYAEHLQAEAETIVRLVDGPEADQLIRRFVGARLKRAANDGWHSDAGSWCPAP